MIHLNLILTSDFPASTPAGVVEQMRAVAGRPRIAWIAEPTERSEPSFAEAERRFAALGFDTLEYCGVGDDVDQVQLAYLHEFDILYLQGDDPVRFRYHVLRSGLSGRLRHCAAAGRLIVTSGAASQLMTPNVSLYRLHAESVDDVLATRWRFDGTGAVAYEILPHVDRLDSAFLESVLRYSARIENDIIGLSDGAALFHIGPHSFTHVGDIVRYRAGALVR